MNVLVVVEFQFILFNTSSVYEINDKDYLFSVIRLLFSPCGQCKSNMKMQINVYF